MSTSIAGHAIRATRGYYWESRAGTRSPGSVKVLGRVRCINDRVVVVRPLLRGSGGQRGSGGHQGRGDISTIVPVGILSLRGDSSLWPCSEVRRVRRKGIASGLWVGRNRWGSW